MYMRIEAGSGVVAFSVPRGAVESGDPYAGFNACHYVGDDEAHVASCRRQLASELGIDVDRLFIPRQTHSTNVRVIHSVSAKDVDLEDCDAMVTDRRGIALCINTADCLPIVFNDPKNGVIGVAHAGWRGVYGGIIASAIAKMTEIGGDVDEMCAAFGPCIRGDCYEVDADLGEKFRERFPEVEGLVAPGRRTGKVQLDLVKGAVSQLKSSGIVEDRISLPPLCNHCHSDEWFSARILGINSGRILTAILRK